MTSSLPIRRKERKTLVFATASDESEEEGIRSVGVTNYKTNEKVDRNEVRIRQVDEEKIAVRLKVRQETEVRSQNERLPATPWQTPKTSQRTKTKYKTPVRDSSSDENSSSEQDENESMIRMSRPKQILKPPKFDGMNSFETFWAQFKNCAEHNKWDRMHKLVYLQS